MHHNIMVFGDVFSHTFNFCENSKIEIRETVGKTKVAVLNFVLHILF